MAPQVSKVQRRLTAASGVPFSAMEGPGEGAHWEPDLGALVSPSVSCGHIPNPLALGRLPCENKRERGSIKVARRTYITHHCQLSYALLLRGNTHKHSIHPCTSNTSL